MRTFVTDIENYEGEILYADDAFHHCVSGGCNLAIRSSASFVS
jgi:hypothetical protein